MIKENSLSCFLTLLFQQAAINVQQHFQAKAEHRS